MRLRRPAAQFLVCLTAVALLATGCGSGGGAGSAGTPATAAETGTRTVTDATGNEVEVPAAPQRVVTTHYAATQSVYDLDVPLVGQGTFEPNIIPEENAEEVEAVPVVTSGQEVDVEQVAGLEPDLILAPNITEEDVLAQLRDVAPVYVFTLRGGDRADWQQRVEEVADALNRTDRVAELRGDLEGRQEDLAREYADVIDGTVVGVVAAYEENNFYAWGQDNMTGTLLMPLGFTWSAQENAAVAGEPEAEATVSTERLTSTLGDADVLFVDTNLRNEVNPFMQSVQATSLYQQLPAVQNDRAFPLGKATVAGYTDANYTLDQVESALRRMRDS